MIEFDNGDLVDSRYEVLDNLGSGGMGTVLKVKDNEDENIFALKYCFEDNEELKSRFSREVRILIKIDHKNVIDILNSNLDYIPPYFIMPLAKCSSLDIISELKADHVKGIDIFLEVCQGAHAIHSIGAFHRDINPKNILIMENEQVVLSDLGLARFEERDTPIITATNQVLGTRIYAAPEQGHPEGSRNADARADVYQLGKTLYHFLTGEYPTLIDAEKIPTGLSYIIERSTKENPRDRYQTVAELIDVINDYRRSLDEDLSPENRFNQLLEEANELLKENKYKEDNVRKMVDTVVFCKDSPEIFLILFDKIPHQLLNILSNVMTAEFEPLLKKYSTIIDNSIGGCSFSYADIVSEKMVLVFNKSNKIELKKLALKCILCAGVDLNRFKAMNDFNEILKSLSDREEIIAAADVLRSEINRYRRISDQLPKGQLNPALFSVYDKANEN